MGNCLEMYRVLYGLCLTCRNLTVTDRQESYETAFTVQDLYTVHLLL
jgi:hypothetical protein